ncbi:hypothetical protein LXA43DRAFT_73937 [Ganoderma leucocontextum]|nr:hypothetical protein LXA43DRAFT_73937 [Ganoderma leucocontextum]
MRTTWEAAWKQQRCERRPNAPSAAPCSADRRWIGPPGHGTRLTSRSNGGPTSTSFSSLFPLQPQPYIACMAFTRAPLALPALQSVSSRTNHRWMNPQRCPGVPLLVTVPSATRLVQNVQWSGHVQLSTVAFKRQCLGSQTRRLQHIRGISHSAGETAQLSRTGQGRGIHLQATYKGLVAEETELTFPLNARCAYASYTHTRLGGGSRTAHT